MKRPFDDIELTRRDRFLIHLFGFYDHLEARGLRDLYTPTPSAFKTYFAEANAQTPDEKLKIIRHAKEQKTRHLIYMRREYGYIPWKMIKKSWTACGWVRLAAAYLHPVDSASQGKSHKP